MPTLTIPKNTKQEILDKVKFNYEQIDSTNQVDIYKCVLRYEGRQLTTKFTLGNRKAFPQKLDVIYSLIQDFKVVYEHRNLYDFMGALGYSDERQANQIFESLKKMGYKVTRLFGDDLRLLLN